MITTEVGPKPVDFADVRTTNLAVVLRHVRTSAPCSRADIAAATGLNKATVSSLVSELIERRLVRETGLAEQRIGRPATLLVLDGAPYAAIGLAVEIDHLTVVATDLAGERLLCWRRVLRAPDADTAEATGDSAEHVVASVAALARRAVSRLTAENRKILGLTIAIPGLVEPSGKVRLVADFRWQDVDLVGPLQRALRRPTYPISIDNNANVAALAEHRYGPWRSASNLVYLVGAAGIGAGIVTDGRLLRGASGFAGEIGHVTVDPAGPRCGCGRTGCVEALAGPASIVRRLSEDAGRTSGVLDLQPEIEDVARRAIAGEPAVLAVLDEAGRALGHAAAILANVVNPEIVVLGGYLSTLARWLLPSASAELTARAFAPAAGGCRVVASTLDISAAATGAAAKVLDAVDSGQVQALRA